MAKHSFTHHNGFTDPSDLLQEIGATIEIEISPTDSLKNFFKKQRKPIPPTIKGLGIIDTGATTTCVNKSILKGFGGEPVGTRNVFTPGKHTDLDVYPAKISFPSTTITTKFEEALAMEDIEFIYKGKPILAFLGRDVLSNCIFIYNGKNGEYCLEC